MERSISTIVFIAILILLGYFFWAAFSPYYFHDVTPNAPMQVVINGKPWYIPMGYMEPHYPDGQYTRGGEAEVWLSLNSADFKIIPQDVAKDTLRIGPAIDVILSGKTNVQTQKAMQELAALKNQTDWAPAPYGLQTKVIGTHVEYIDKDTRISCGRVNCTLFTPRIPDLYTAMVFSRDLVPHWQEMVSLLAIELQPFRTKPPLTNVFKNFFTLQPTGADKPPTTTNGILMPPGQQMPEIAVPTLNTR